MSFLVPMQSSRLQPCSRWQADEECCSGSNACTAGAPFLPARLACKVADDCTSASHNNGLLQICAAGLMRMHHCVYVQSVQLLVCLFSAIAMHNYRYD